MEKDKNSTMETSKLSKNALSTSGEWNIHLAERKNQQKHKKKDHKKKGDEEGRVVACFPR
jgi:hypothetical protein